MKFSNKDLTTYYDQLRRTDYAAEKRMGIALQVIEKITPKSWLTNKQQDFVIMKLLNVSEKNDPTLKICTRPDNKIIAGLDDERIQLLLMFLESVAQEVRI